MLAPQKTFDGISRWVFLFVGLLRSAQLRFRVSVSRCNICPACSTYRGHIRSTASTLEQLHTALHLISVPITHLRASHLLDSPETLACMLVHIEDYLVHQEDSNLMLLIYAFCSD